MTFPRLGETWTEKTTFKHSRSGRLYAPHTPEEFEFVRDFSTRYLLAKGGEGSGKTVVGSIMTLMRVGLGMSGIVVSPDLPHFRRSTWMEFRNWIPWKHVVAKYQYYGDEGWYPTAPFVLPFDNGAELYMGGIREPRAWEGPNVSFAWIDEARRIPTADALKTLDGRVRVPGPNGEMPQIFLTTTPRKNWLYDYFGPMLDADPYEAFKINSRVLTMLTEDNEINTVAGFTQLRGQSLSGAEYDELLRGEWVDTEDTDRFLPHMQLWTRLREAIPELDERTPVVVGVDAAVSGDTFGVVVCSRHPVRKDAVAVRQVMLWKPPPGQRIDFTGTEDNPGPEIWLRNFFLRYNVVEVAYDPYQLHHMAQRLGQVEQLAYWRPFNQNEARMQADADLYAAILSQRLFHPGDERLDMHIENCNRRAAEDDRTRLRLVKRHPSAHIDLAVALSMARARTEYLNLE